MSHEHLRQPVWSGPVANNMLESEVWRSIDPTHANPHTAGLRVGCPCVGWIKMALREDGLAMRGKLLTFTIAFIVLAGYVASPFVTAWTIREAIRNGDAATLETKVNWPRIKASLKSSMAVYALGPPAASAIGKQADIATPAPRPSLWQRIKTAYGRSVVNAMVDRMATPAALPKLFSYRQSYNKRVRGLPDEAEAYSFFERIRRTWSRITRAEFLSHRVFVMEMRDKDVADRSYHGVLELEGLVWKLVHLEVRRVEEAHFEPINQQPNMTSSVWSRMRQAALP